MKIAIIGTGYVGLPTGVGFAQLGHHVVCIDREIRKIEKLQNGVTTIYEQGLEELLKSNLASGNITFTTSMAEGVNDADLVLIAVGTPPHPITHEADMQYVYSAASEIAQHLNKYTVIATKSTVPVGTGDIIESMVKKANPNVDFDVVSLPEFLREGYAVDDFFNPDRIVIGANTQKAKDVIEEIYKPFDSKIPRVYVNRKSSETIKYAANSFLAMKIHYINEIANFCEKVGADILEVARGVGLDSRIGSKFLNPGPGFGGSCFPKDTMAMSYMAHQNDINLTLIDNVIEGNKRRKKNFAKEIVDEAKALKLDKINIAVLGLAFKAGTDDCRDSPSIEILKEIINISDNCNIAINIKAYDPKAMIVAKQILEQAVEYADNIKEAVKDSHLLIILTEWSEFKAMDLQELKTLMQGNIIFDLRNLLNKEQAVELGFKYRGIGR